MGMIRNTIFLVLTGLYFMSLSAAITIPRAARADEVYTFIVKKQEEKKKTNWYLTDWFETKEKMRVMDMWLALHSPSPYEFYVGPEYQIANNSSTPGKFSSNVWKFSAAAYASIFGLGLEKRFNPQSEWTALFLLRIFGYTAQSTNLTLQAGVRSEGDPVNGRNGVLGVSGTMLLVRPFLGIDGMYRHYFPSAGNSSGTSSEGYRWEVGPFIDFGFLRVFGKYFYESETDTSLNVQTPASGSGALVGTKLFF
ncbi:MAG: hypothetical protein P4M08_11165 [Oligoflexia bacterium]|nr:hypothetical protein [Oligoflexia bacterium]